MSAMIQAENKELNSCGCCEGISQEVPVKIQNREGLEAIAYRVGNQPLFKQSMLAGLSRKNALKSLTSREDDDFTIAYLDACATVFDVLTFYQERIANESYLRTATDRFSVRELARLTGYELRPGLAANTFLAFTIDESHGTGMSAASNGSPDPDLPSVNITSGTKVQSIPGAGEDPQTFETTENLEARSEWNSLKPKILYDQLVTEGSEVVVVKGTGNNLKKGDILLIQNSSSGTESGTLKKIRKVVPDETLGTTWLYLTSNENALATAVSLPPSEFGSPDLFSEKTPLDEEVIQTILSLTWNQEDLNELIEKQNWAEKELIESMRQQIKKPVAQGKVWVFRKQASVFGHNAGQNITYSGTSVSSEKWDLNESAGKIYLDSNYDEILPESFIAILKPGKGLEEAVVEEIEDVITRSRYSYGTSGKTTELNLKSENQWWDSSESDPDDGKLSLIRDYSILIQSEPLELAQIPIEDSIEESKIIFDSYYPGLKPGRNVLVKGTRTDLGVTFQELKEVKEVLVENGFTVLYLTSSLSHKYERKTASVNANVVFATHGETVEETLGSGDASKAFQRFKLKQQPLTYVSGNSSDGLISTLEVRVNDQLWEEVPTLFGRGPGEHVYTTRLSNDEGTTVMFGDGKTGARLPSGSENVKAKYRKGSGLEGLVNADQLSQLITRPAGVREVRNPIPSEGADSSEGLEDARKNAPLSILTLDRVVSLKDYENFANAFAGIGKALATWTWKDRRRYIFLTLSGPDGESIDVKGKVCSSLLSSLKKLGDPEVSVLAYSYIPAFFKISANIKVDPVSLQEEVFSHVEEKLRTEFSFSRRSFGQPVALSEVISVVQQVDGVLAVDIDAFFRTDSPGLSLNQYLEAYLPKPGEKTILAAELLMLDPGTIDLHVMP